MLNLQNHYGIQLHAQHSLQSEDILKVCSLAQIGENTQETFEKISTLNFEQFFGFTCHLFVTAESQTVRETLANILPKFGSLAVLSLLKISHHFQARLQTNSDSNDADRNVVELANYSLETMELQPLAIGIANAITASESDEIMTTLVPTLIKLTYHHGAALFSLIEQQTVESRWNVVKIELIRTLAELRYQERFTDNAQPNQPHPVKVRVKKETVQQTSEVA